MPEASPHPLPESDRFARLPPGRSGLPGLPDSAHAASLPQILALRHPCRPGSPRQSRPGDPPPAADPRSRRRPGRSLTGFRPTAAAAPPSCSTRSPTRAMSGPCSARPGRSEFLPCGRERSQRTRGIRHPHQGRLRGSRTGSLSAHRQSRRDPGPPGQGGHPRHRPRHLEDVFLSLTAQNHGETDLPEIAETAPLGV